MVIHDKGLLKAIKAAARGKGYELGIRTLESGEDYFVLHGEGWTVETLRKYIPREVLALIVQHCGFIPEAGTVHKITKHMGAEAELPDEFWAATVATVAGADAWVNTPNAFAKHTGLVYGGDTTLMKTRGGKLLPVDSTLLDIGSGILGMHSDGNILIFQGNVSMVVIGKAELPANRMDYLTRIGDAIQLSWDEEEE